jgi:acyl homoserine lactone synthase
VVLALAAFSGLQAPLNKAQHSLYARASRAKCHQPGVYIEKPEWTAFSSFQGRMSMFDYVCVMLYYRLLPRSSGSIADSYMVPCGVWDRGNTDVIVIGGPSQLAPELVGSALGEKIFVRRLGWSLPLVEHMERDQYDDDHAVYFVVQSAAGTVTACARLLPTTREYMLSTLCGELLGDSPPPCDSSIWELNRFPTSLRNTADGRVSCLADTTRTLLSAIVGFSRCQGIARLILATTVSIERLLIRAGFDVHRFGAPRRLPGGLFVGLFIEVA